MEMSRSSETVADARLDAQTTNKNPRSASPEDGGNLDLDHFIANVVPALATSTPSFKLWSKDQLLLFAELDHLREMFIAFGLLFKAKLRARRDVHASSQSPVASTTLCHARSCFESATHSTTDSIDPETDARYSMAATLFFAYMKAIFLTVSDMAYEAHVCTGNALAFIHSHAGLLETANDVASEAALLVINLAANAWPFQPGALSESLYKLPDLSFTKVDKQWSDIEARATIDFQVIKHFRFSARVTIGSQDTRQGLITEGKTIAASCSGILSTMGQRIGESGRVESSAIDKARLKICQISAKTVVSRYQTSYDQYLSEFIEALDAVELGLLRRTETVAGSRVPVVFEALNAVSVLAAVAFLCRHPKMRRRALELLEKCPEYDGLTQTRRMKAMLRTAIQFEERNMTINLKDISKIWIPEEDRIHFLKDRTISEPVSSTSPRGMEILHRPDGDSGYLSHYVDLVYEMS